MKRRRCQSVRTRGTVLVLIAAAVVTAMAGCDSILSGADRAETCSEWSGENPTLEQFGEMFGAFERELDQVDDAYGVKASGKSFAELPTDPEERQRLEEFVNLTPSMAVSRYTEMMCGLADGDLRESPRLGEVRDDPQNAGLDLESWNRADLAVRSKYTAMQAFTPIFYCGSFRLSGQRYTAESFKAELKGGPISTVKEVDLGDLDSTIEIAFESYRILCPDVFTD